MTNKPKVKLMGLRWQDHIVGDPVDTAMHLKYLHQKLIMLEAMHNEGEYCEVCGVHYDEEDPCPFH